MKAILTVLALLLSAPALAADTDPSTCYVCDASSACKQCPYNEKDTPVARKNCKASGCDVVDTGKCSRDPKVTTCTPAR